MKCLQEHITDVRDYIDEPSDDSSEWTDSRIVSHINSEIKKIGTKIIKRSEDFFGVRIVIPLVTGTYEYQIPDGHIRSVEIIKTGVTDNSNNVYTVAYNADRYKLDRLDFYENDYYEYNPTQHSISGPSGYFQFGNRLLIGDGTYDITTGYYLRVWLIPSLVGLHYGSMVSATSNTIVISTATYGELPLVSNSYLNYGVRIYSGTGANQERKIIGDSYSASTGYHTLTLDSAWGTTPSGTVVYSILPPFLPEFEDAISMGAALRCKIKVEDPMSELFQLYNECLNDALSLITPRSRDGVRRVRRTACY